MEYEKNPDKKITIVVASCDLYEDAWMPFFRLIEKHWSECTYNKVLITEEKEFQCDFMKVKSEKTGKDMSWTERVKSTLSKIESEYIFFFLEDFFLMQKVNQEAVDSAIALMDCNKNIGVINFYPGSSKENYTDICKPDFKKVSINQPYRTKVMVGLWRKEYFERLLYGKEDPWTYERESSIRSIFAGYDVYMQDYKTSRPIFLYYVNPKDGMGITRSKWLKKNREYFISQGIYDVEYDKLGIIEEDVTYTKTQKEDNERRSMKHKEYIQSLSGLSKLKEIIYDFKHKYIIKKFKIDKVKKYYKYWKYYKTKRK